ncbi:related to Protein phosphatase 2C homolog 6 [Saccharomycodes ludwigii]|uniref:Related to Protein phosphatase 2C homolog 6 n=2 Tax=Saccharomycodes ludwigii TaxID=36035 RepID=A0A376B6A5_9ASCO|nr:related to Protein phosphatase 2C homolog 6 [Saccharomycodes ludwigii]
MISKRKKMLLAKNVNLNKIISKRYITTGIPFDNNAKTTDNYNNDTINNDNNTPSTNNDSGSFASKYIHWTPSNITSGMLRLDLYKIPSYIGHCSSRINRLYNEDRYSFSLLKYASNYKRAVTNTKNSPTFLNINIFDGHGGSNVSTWLSKHLHEKLVQTIPNKKTFYSILKQYCLKYPHSDYWLNIYENREAYYKRFIRTCSTKKEDVLYNGSRMIFDKFGNIIDKTSLLSDLDRLRIFQTYLEVDLKDCIVYENCGSTASSIFLTPYAEYEQYTKPSSLDDNNSSNNNNNNNNVDDFNNDFLLTSQSLMKLCVVQVGDCKVILCDKHGVAHSLTQIHHANSPRETARLNSSKLSITDSFGETRFLDMFANTRSFGDSKGKEMGLSCEPDIYSYLIGNTSKLPHQEKSKLQFGGDECFICMVTDGVTDLMDDQEIIDLITSTVNMRGLKKATPQLVCEEVIKYISAISGKDADNATCLVYRLSNWGNWPVIDRTGALREEKLLNTNQAELRE